LGKIGGCRLTGRHQPTGLLFAVLVYTVYCCLLLFIAVYADYAVYAISSLDTGSPRHAPRLLLCCLLFMLRLARQHGASRRVKRSGDCGPLF
jgi:hypothetical protein